MNLCSDVLIGKYPTILYVKDNKYVEYTGKRKMKAMRKYIEGGYAKDFGKAKLLLEQDADGKIVIHPDDMLKEF